MARPRSKMDLRDFESLGVSFIDCSRVRDKKGNRGWRYLMEKRLTEPQRTAVERFQNTIIGTARYRHAPEIVRDTIIIMDQTRSAWK